MKPHLFCRRNNQFHLVCSDLKIKQDYKQAGMTEGRDTIETGSKNHKLEVIYIKIIIKTIHLT